LAKERNVMVKKKKKECGTRNQFYGSWSIGDVGCASFD
jgi:hypothetical protein